MKWNYSEMLRNQIWLVFDYGVFFEAWKLSSYRLLKEAQKIMSEYYKCLICALRWTKVFWVCSVRVNSVSEWTVCHWMFWRSSSLGFAAVFQILLHKHTCFFSSFFLLYNYDLISVLSQLLIVYLLFWGSIAALKSLYCSVHYRGLVVGLFKLLWHE